MIIATLHQVMHCSDLHEYIHKLFINDSYGLLLLSVYIRLYTNRLYINNISTYFPMIKWASIPYYL